MCVRRCIPQQANKIMMFTHTVGLFLSPLTGNSGWVQNKLADWRQSKLLSHSAHLWSVLCDAASFTLLKAHRKLAWNQTLWIYRGKTHKVIKAIVIIDSYNNSLRICPVENKTQWKISVAIAACQSVTQHLIFRDENRGRACKYAWAWPQFQFTKCPI